MTTPTKYQDLVILSGEFGRYPSSIEHMVRSLAVWHRILWVEVTGMRRPQFTVYDLKRAVGKIGRLLRGANRIESAKEPLPRNLTLAAPFTIPLPGLTGISDFNRWRTASAIRTKIRELDFKKFGLITTLPMTAGAVASARADWTLYYCPDEWSLWPGMNQKLVRCWEDQLMTEVDAVAVSSQALKESKSRLGRTATIVPHGVDVDHFRKAFSERTARKIAFFGMFDARIDQQLIAKVAREFPDFMIELIGPVQCPISEDLIRENVVFTGVKDYRTLPDTLKGVRYLMLPYVRNELTRNINPLKARECLAAGKPVIATALPELRSLENIFVSESDDEFVAHIHALENGETSFNAALAMESVQSQSWNHRAYELLQVVIS